MSESQRERERRRLLDMALACMETQFGRGTIQRLGNSIVSKAPVISSGCISIDRALGGGFPAGRIVEIYGPESSGKTTIALHAIAESQRNGGTAVFLDAEHALEPAYARKLGVDMENLLFSQPESGEQALEITAALLGTSLIDIAVIDSVAALVPQAELDGTLELGSALVNGHPALHSGLMSRALRKLTPLVARKNACLIFLNQLREKVGVTFGNPETTTGGRALKFHASVRAEVRRTGVLKESGLIVGSRTRLRVVKNKVAPPFRAAEFDIVYGEGVACERDLLDTAIAENVVETKGPSLFYRGKPLGEGRERAQRFLKEYPETAWKLASELRERLGLWPEGPAPRPPMTPPFRLLRDAAGAA